MSYTKTRAALKYIFVDTCNSNNPKEYKSTSGHPKTNVTDAGWIYNTL